MKAQVLLIAGLLALIGCRKSPAPPPPPVPRPSTQAVGVHFQEGFGGLPVVVTYCGSQVYTGRPATDQKLGFAGSFGFEPGPVPSGLLELRVGEMTFSQTIDWTVGRALGLNIETGKLVVKQSPYGFGYD